MAARPATIFAVVQSNALRERLTRALPGQTVTFHTGSFDPPDAAIAVVADLYPSLIVAELGTADGWLSPVRSDPATRRYPMIGIGTGEQAARRAAAVHIPFYEVATFAQDAPRIVALHQRTAGSGSELADPCAAPPPPLVRRGLHEFNAAEYYECHETLETAWMAEPGPVRNLYRVILQISVAYYQITRGNYHGARKMFLRANQWFDGLPDRCQGIDIAQLRADAAAVRAHLESLGPDRIGAFDRSLLKPIRFEDLDARQVP